MINAIAQNTLNFITINVSNCYSLLPVKTMWHKSIILLSSVLILAISNGQSIAAEKIYKWTDSDGNIHYSDQPHKTEQSEEINVSPAPSRQATEEAKQRKQQLKSTANLLEKERLQREKDLAEEQKKRDAELAEEKARQEETPTGQNIDRRNLPRPPNYPRPHPVPPNYPTPHPNPPAAVPLPSGANPGGT